MRRPFHVCSLFAVFGLLAASPALPASVSDLRDPAVRPASQSVPGTPADRTQTIEAPPLQPPAPAPGNPVAVVSTSMGDFTIELFADRAPVSVENFLQYAREGHYGDTVFHRVKPGFMIQGGGFTPSLSEKTTRPPIQNEATNGLRNLRGTVAMARTTDPHSATAQFFVNVTDNKFLDHQAKDGSKWGYAVFGTVIEGMEVVDAIKGVKTGASGPFAENAPVEPVIITHARRR